MEFSTTHLSFSLKKKKNYLWPHWLFVAAGASLWLRRVWTALWLWGVGFSRPGHRLSARAPAAAARGLRRRGPRALEHRLNSCGPRASLLHGMQQDLPRPGIEPGSPASAGAFFSTEPPGKPPFVLVSQENPYIHLK